MRNTHTERHIIGIIRSCGENVTLIMWNPLASLLVEVIRLLYE